MSVRMQRREFISLMGGAAASSALPLAARAQQPAMPVVGFLNGGSRDQLTDRVRAFRQGLSEAGYVPDRNVAIEYRWADGHTERLPALAADLVRRQVAVIVATGGPPPALAAKAATATIPIVFLIGSDPVDLGFVGSLNRPGGNMTGVTNLSVELGPKRLELLREMVPSVQSVALLINPTSTLNASTLASEMQASARILGLQVHVLHASDESEFETVFASLMRLQARALVIGADAYFNSRRERLGAMAARYAVPAIFQSREFAAAGGLMSYGGGDDSYRQIGFYAGRILKGEKAADLPVQQAAKVELILNLKSAKALGITVPLTLLGRADEVIE